MVNFVNVSFDIDKALEKLKSLKADRKELNSKLSTIKQRKERAGLNLYRCEQSGTASCDAERSELQEYEIQYYEIKNMVASLDENISDIEAQIQGYRNSHDEKEHDSKGKNLINPKGVSGEMNVTSSEIDAKIEENKIADKADRTKRFVAFVVVIVVGLIVLKKI